MKQLKTGFLPMTNVGSSPNSPNPNRIARQGAYEAKEANSAPRPSKPSTGGPKRGGKKY